VLVSQVASETGGEIGTTMRDREAPEGHKVGVRKRIALIAHDNRKADLLAWAKFNRGTLARHELLGTGTTGGLISEELALPVHRFLSGPLGGDQQVGAAIAEGRIDAVIFFWDPLEPHPHDVDVKALLRVAVVHNVAIACNRATADFVLSSPLMNQEYAPTFTPEADEAVETP
jgi:methylglyoxal synthase